MSKLTFICYERCSTCQKARKWLDAQGIAYETRAIDKDNPTAGELRGWIEQSGLPPRRFFNTSGQLYRSLGVKAKLDAGLSEDEQIALLATDGMLVKRPLLVGDGLVTVGFKEAVWGKLLGLS